MGKSVYLKEYDFTLAANEIKVILATGEYFRIQSSSGAVSIGIDGLGELPGLLAGQGIGSTPFQRLTLRDVSGAANVGKLLVSNEAFIDNRTYGVNSLDSATIFSIKRPEAPSATFASNTLLTANTAQAVFNPGSNTNGAILLSALAWDQNSGTEQLSLLAKSSAPASSIDGDPVAMGIVTFNNGTVVGASIDLKIPQFIPAGLGLYFYCTRDMVAGNLRSCRYKLL